MKTNYFLLVLVFLLLLENCRTFKNELILNGDHNNAIQNAILDFSSTSRLYKKAAVFSVSFHDTLYRMILEETNDGNHRWVEGKPYKGIVAISISVEYNKLFLAADAKVGSKGKLPSRYIEKEGKLFYWWDDDYPLKKEALTIYHKYNLLQGNVISALDFSINDAQKGVDYYFCKNDLSKYKKVITDKGIGYYNAPKLNCDSCSNNPK